MRPVSFDTEPPAKIVRPKAFRKSPSAFRRVRCVLLPASAFSAIWWTLNPADPASWIIGAPAIIVATATALLIPQPTAPPLAPWGALQFAGFFVVQTVVGATDVALRAFNPFARPEPGFMTWTTRLPDGAARVAFANAITLLPGTLTAHMEGDRFTIHLLDTRTDPAPQLAVLEARVAAMFALDTETKE
jgi:multicomponent Na+:H+ antiporter subunit E